MNVRCYLHKEKEFYYPESDKMEDMAGFYGVLEGYRLKKKKFTLTWGSKLKDIEGKEIFDGDRVELIFPKTRNKRLYPRELENGIINYSDGGFVFISEDIPGHEFVIETTEKYKIRVTGYAYTNI